MPASWADRFLGSDPRRGGGVGFTAAPQRRRQESNRKAVSNLLAVIPDKELKAVCHPGGRTQSIDRSAWPLVAD